MYEKKFSNNKNRGFKNDRPARPRNVPMTFSLVDEFVSTAGNTVNTQTIMDILDDLNRKDIFTTISIPTQISRALLTGDNDKRGNMNVGYIHSFDIANKTVDVVVYATSVEGVQKMADANALVYKPRILSKGDEFVTFLSFDLVAAD